MNLVEQMVTASALSMVKDAEPIVRMMPRAPRRDCRGRPVQPGEGYWRRSDGALQRTDKRGNDRFIRRARIATARQQRRRAKADRRNHAKPALQ